MHHPFAASAPPADLYWTALAVDMTARNLQDEVKKKGLPWSAVKGFDTFTPIRCVNSTTLTS